MPRDVWIVPHTHWDREWYAGFQTFRLRLVDLLDHLLPELEHNPAYAHFMLDGQMAVVDDYLAVRPEEEARLRRLAANGRLGLGPWSILMDEFLVSGETMVRNLQAGLARAAAFGGAMEVGYLPDMFGHVAQMPQILSQFGFEHAVVWRGVPSHVDRSGFWWQAPDGSTVRAEYLPDGYGNGAGMPDDAKELVERVRRFEEHWGAMLVGPILWMNGTDHQLPQPWLGRVVAEANEIQDDHRLRVASLAEYLRHAPTDGLPTWRGELRSGARANLLMGVASNRVDVKQAAARAERWLERVAEPAAALHEPPHRWPGSRFGEAWRQLVLNSAHDSSCACSIDEVCDAVLVRYAEARQAAEGLARRAARTAGARLATAGDVVLNTTQRPRAGVVELRLAGHEHVPGTQLLEERGGQSASEEMTVAAIAEVTRLALVGDEQVHGAEVEERDGVLEVRLHRGPRAAGEAGDALEPAAALAELASAVGRLGRDGPARLATVSAPRRRVLAWCDEVPGFGWRRWESGELPVAPVTLDGAAAAKPLLANGLVTVEIDRTDGTFSLDGIGGFGRLVDDGDVGDTYNWCPPREQHTVDEATSVEVHVLEDGPLRGRVAIDRTYVLPERADGMDRRVGEVRVPIRTTVELQAGSTLVGVTVELDNRCADHRLRVVLPLPVPATASRAECAFGVTERPLWAEGGPTESPMATQPMRRFVCAGDITVVQDGLLEYELVDLDGDPEEESTRAHALALTLLRCTGLLSRGPMATRPLPAGPVIATPGAQMPGPQVLRFALARGDDPVAAYARADEAFTPLLVTRSAGTGNLGDVGATLEVDGAEVSSICRQDGLLTLRVFNPRNEATTVELPRRRGWLVDLRGRLVASFEGSFELRPWGIATAQLEEQ